MSHRSVLLNPISSVLLIAALLLHVPQSVARGAQKAALSEAAERQIDEVVQRHVSSGGISGAVTLVARNGSVVYLKASGTEASGSSKPLRTDSVFWIASLTKPIVAASVMLLEQEGKLRLEDPVGKYIAEFKEPGTVRVLRPDSPPHLSAYLAWGPLLDPNAPKPQYDLVPASRAITIRDLIAHTSGLGTIGLYNEAVPAPAPDETVADWVPKLARVPLDFQPGSAWSYSNATGYDILVRIVEIVSGQPFEKFLARRILGPLGMKDTGFLGKSDDLRTRALAVPERFAKLPCVVGAAFICGSGGMWGTAEDYARFAQMLLNEGRSSSGQQILQARTVRKIVADHAGALFPDYQGISTKGADFGLNVIVIRDSAAAGVGVPEGSFGWDGMGMRRFWVIPAHRAVLVMMIPEGKAAPVHRELEKVVTAALRP